jgi:hypothetical protein
MPVSKFKPDPSVVQSGYYNDRNGTPNAIPGGRITGDDLTAATQETARTVQAISKAISTGVISSVGAPGEGAPSAAQIVRMMKGGAAPAQSSADDNRFNLVETPGGWFVPANDPRARNAMAVIEDLSSDGAVPFGFDDGIRKSDTPAPEPSDDDNEPDAEEQEERAEAKEKMDEQMKKRVQKAQIDKTPVQKSFFAALAEGRQIQKAVRFATPADLEKGMYGSWYEQYMGTPLEVEAIQCELDFVKAKQGLDNKSYKGKDRDKYYDEMDKLRAKFNEKRVDLEIRLLEHKRDRAKQYAAMNKSEKKTMDLKKGGEGSRGGKVIGHTASGKPVYAQKYAAHGSSFRGEHEKMTPAQHREHAKVYMEHHGSGKTLAHNHSSSHAHQHVMEANRKEGKGTVEGLKESRAMHQATADAKKKKVKKASGVPGAMEKGIDMSGLEGFIQKSEADTQRVSAKSAGDILDEFIQKSQGMPEGGPRKDLPRSMNQEDGGNLAGVGQGSGPQDAGMATVESTAKKRKQKGKNYAGTGLAAQPVADAELEVEGKGLEKSFVTWDDIQDEQPERLSTMAKALNEQMDWSKAGETGARLRAMLNAQLQNQDLDEVMGLGVAPAAAQLQIEEEGAKVTMIQKGILYESDRDDQRIEKAMEQYASDGGLTFAQPASVNLNGQLQKMQTCGTCGTLTKSMYASCQGCGSPIHAAAPHAQGLHLGPELQKSIIVGEEEDLFVG